MHFYCNLFINTFITQKILRAHIFSSLVNFHSSFYTSIRLISTLLMYSHYIIIIIFIWAVILVCVSTTPMRPCPKKEMLPTFLVIHSSGLQILSPKSIPTPQLDITISISADIDVSKYPYYIANPLAYRIITFNLPTLSLHPSLNTSPQLCTWLYNLL